MQGHNSSYSTIYREASHNSQVRVTFQDPPKVAIETESKPLERRKFDIRQWFMVTSFDPLEAWIYDGCYLRFSGINFNSKVNL